MAYPFKTYQRNIPAEKTEIYTASRQELIFNATVCNQGAEDATISLWTRIGGVESPVEFQTPVLGTNAANNRAIAVALNKINLDNGDAILASTSSGNTSSISFAEAFTTNWGEAFANNWGETFASQGSNTSPSLDTNLTLNFSVLF
jgi:hypothetical protein